MGRAYAESDGKPQVIEPGAVNLGIAVDVERKDGSRSLMVPCIKGADRLDFAAFHAYYEELINKTRENKLTADDFQGTNITLTNPGGLGTVASVPRLLAGQGTIVATGSIAYPAEWAHAPADKLKALGVSKVMTMTSTYDHRIIQGAESGLVPAPHRPAPPGRGQLLRVGRRVAGRWPPPSSPTPTPPRRPGADRRAGAASPTAAPAGHRAPAGRAGRDLAPQGLPDPRPPGGAARPARQGAQGRPGDRAREPQPDPGADVEDPRVDPADRGRGRDPARGPAADARRLLRNGRLPDRAPLLAPAAHVAAGDDRDRSPSSPADARRRSAPCSRG